MLAERQAMLLAALHPPQTVYAFRGAAYQAGGERHSTVDVQVCNLLRYPVVLRQVRAGGRSADIQPDWIVGSEGAASDHDALLHREALPSVVLRRVQGDVPRYVTLHIPTHVISDLVPQSASVYSGTLQIVTQLIGIEDLVVVDVLSDYPSPLSAPVPPAQPSVQEALERYPFLEEADQPGFLRLRPGTWHVEGDLVLPDGVGLWTTESVTLTFDRQAVFFSTGPLMLRGPDDGGIYLVPKDGYWAGLVVLHTGPAGISSLYNVEIRATRGIRRSGWITTGGVTFYESPVVIRHSRLLDSRAQDMINIVRSDFEFSDTEFGIASGDAFDGDFVQGRIERCAFHDVMENAINVSGSDVAIRDVSLFRVYDKAISAGEGSVVTAQGIRAKDVGIAFASRDMSSVRVQDVRIAQAWTAGFAAYLEKMEYGPASIQASRVVFEDDSVQVLVQEGSSATINGTAAAARELDENDLRRRKETPPPMRPLNYRLGPAIWLVGYDLLTPELAPGDRLQLILYWRALASLDRQYTIFVHVLDASGQTVAGWDTMPRQNTFPTTDWPVEELIDDTHFVPLSRELPAGEYRLALGMYYWWTGERLPVSTRDGEQVPDAAIILEQTVRVK